MPEVSVTELPELATRAQVSSFTQIAVPTLARWAVEGSGPRMVKLGSAVRYRRADVLAWLEASERTSTAEANA